MWSRCKRPENAPMTPSPRPPPPWGTGTRCCVVIWTVASGRVLVGGWLCGRSCAVGSALAWMRSGELARRAQLTVREEQILRIIGLSIEGLTVAERAVRLRSNPEPDPLRGGGTG